MLVSAKGTGDPAPYELRLRSELRTEGLDALLVNAGSKDGDLKPLAARYGANSVIEVVLGDAEATASVWVSEPSLPLEIARTIKVSLTQRDAVAVLALRAVNLYVGARLELDQQRKTRQQLPSSGELAPEPSKTSAPGQVRDVAAPARTGPANAARPAASTNRGVESKSGEKLRLKRFVDASIDERYRLGGGVALMQFTDKLDRRIAPSLEFVVTLPQNWRIGVTATGPFLATRPITYRNENSSIVIDQEFLWLDGRFRLKLGDQLDLEPALGLGVARYGVAGQGSISLAGREVQTVSVINNLGCSLVWRLAPRVRLLVGLEGVLRWQTPRAMAAGKDVTGTSRLNFWGFFGPAWAF